MQSEAMDRKGTFSFRCVADAVVPPTCPWQLCGEVANMPPGLVIDLTTLGEGGDWVHWGRRDARDVDFMARPGGGPVSTRTVAWISIGCICVHEQSICFGLSMLPPYAVVYTF